MSFLDEKGLAHLVSKLKNTFMGEEGVVECFKENLKTTSSSDIESMFEGSYAPPSDETKFIDAESANLLIGKINTILG